MSDQYRTSKYLAVWQVEGSYAAKNRDDHADYHYRSNKTAYIICQTFERACEIYRELCKKESKSGDPNIYITKCFKMRASKCNRFDIIIDEFNGDKRADFISCDPNYVESSK